MEAKYFIILSAFITSTAFAQLEKFGLDNLKITSIALSEKSLPEKLVVAGTGSNGIYFHNLSDSDSVWNRVYFYNRTISSVFIQQQERGPVTYSRIFAGLVPDTSFDRTLIYTTDYPFQSYWSPADSGLNRNEINKIAHFAGHDYSWVEVQHPVFSCAQSSNIYILKNDVWDKAWSGSEFTVINTLCSNASTIWGGGAIQGKTSTLLIIKSENYGINWTEFQPTIGTGYICYSIISPFNSYDTVYAGLNETVIKSIDGGNSWHFTSLKIPNVIFTSLLVNPSNPNQVFAGGKSNGNTFILYKSDNGGESWKQIVSFYNHIIKGINSMACTVINDELVIYIGTDGSGSYRYTTKITSLNNNNKENYVRNFYLYQNYPNPFNPTTQIKYTLKEEGFVTLRVFDILGRQIALLVNEYEKAGSHSINFDAGNLSSGVYFYSISTKDFNSVKRMILLR